MSITVDGLFLAASDAVDPATFITGLLAGVALAVGWAVGAVRLNRIGGPVRLPEDTPILPFASILFGSFGFFILATSLILRVQQPDQPLTEIQTALAACVPPLVGLGAIFLGDRAILPQAAQKLGLSARFIPRGIAFGLLASLITLPVLFFASQIDDQIYKLVHFAHETEHPMLRAMGEAPSLAMRLTLVVAACVIVPIWEEAFFRGHLQTVLRAAFSRLLSEPASEAVATRVPVPPLALDFNQPPLRRIVRFPNATSWLAVIVTSAMFAVLHPLWTVPIIFLLALGLGYAYERTGNLWVSIAMHAAFNSISTGWYLIHGAN